MKPTHQQLLQAVRSAGEGTESFTCADVRDQLGIDTQDRRVLGQFHRSFRAFQDAAPDEIEKLGPNRYRRRKRKVTARGGSHEVARTELVEPEAKQAAEVTPLVLPEPAAASTSPAVEDRAEVGELADAAPGAAEPHATEGDPSAPSPLPKEVAEVFTEVFQVLADAAEVAQEAASTSALLTEPDSLAAADAPVALGEAPSADLLPSVADLADELIELTEAELTELAADDPPPLERDESAPELPIAPLLPLPLALITPVDRDDEPTVPFRVGASNEPPPLPVVLAQAESADLAAAAHAVPVTAAAPAEEPQEVLATASRSESSETSAQESVERREPAPSPAGGFAERLRQLGRRMRRMVFGSARKSRGVGSAA